MFFIRSMGYLAFILLLFDGLHTAYLTMIRPFLWIPAVAIPAYLFGLLNYSELFGYADKINCELPVDRFSEEEILAQRSPGHKVFGLNFQDHEWVIIDGKAIDVYRYTCLDTLYRLYKSGGRQDHKLKQQIKEMLL